VSDENDPLAALSAAAQSRSSNVKPRKVRPVVKTPQPKPRPTAAVKRKRPTKSNPLIYFAFAMMGLVVIAGIILAVVIITAKEEPPPEKQTRAEHDRPISDNGPGSLFSHVKTQDPSK